MQNCSRGEAFSKLHKAKVENAQESIVNQCELRCCVGEARKVIPESRDRMQSRVLVWVVGTVLLFYAVQSLTMGLRIGFCRNASFAILGVSFVLSLMVWMTSAGTPAAAAIGGVICYLIASQTASCKDWALRSGLAPLMAMLVLTLGATRLGKARKVRLGVAEDPRGRTAAQVIANLGIAALCFPWPLMWLERYTSVGRYMWGFNIVPAMMVAALCEAAADTVSSEIGQAFGGRPFLLTKMRLVEPGTDGAVSLIGTLAGIAAAAIVAYVARWGFSGAFGLPIGEAEGSSLTLVVGIAFAGGVAGLFFDSLLGATVERRGWLGNDLVNFLSTAFASGMAWALLRGR